MIFMKSLGNVFILGDSYSTFEGVIPENFDAYYPSAEQRDSLKTAEETWWMHVINETNSHLLKNCSYSGTTVCNITYEGKYCPDTSFVGRIADWLDTGEYKPSDIDTIFVFGGTNDSWADSPIGKPKYSGRTDEDLKSFSPALCELFEILKKTCPKARIINITNTDLKEEISSVMSEICAHYSIQNIVLTKIDKDHGHPTVLGMKNIADEILAAL